MKKEPTIFPLLWLKKEASEAKTGRVESVDDRG
jgi:hypothetical protein